MKWIIEGNTFEDSHSAAEYILDDDYEFDDDQFDDYLNECEEPIRIWGYTYDAAEVLKSVDDNAYYDAKSEWSYEEVRSLREDLIYLLERMDHNEEESQYGYNILAIDEDAEEDDNEDEEEQEEEEDVEWLMSQP